MGNKRKRGTGCGEETAKKLRRNANKMDGKKRVTAKHGKETPGRKDLEDDSGKRLRRTNGEKRLKEETGAKKKRSRVWEEESGKQRLVRKEWEEDNKKNRRGRRDWEEESGKNQQGRRYWEEERGKRDWEETEKRRMARGGSEEKPGKKSL